MASKYRKKFALPEDFYQILESYSREVLRDQPLDIIEFSYLYFKAMEEDTLDEFDYPRKGQNIPPSKFDRPLTEQDEGEGEDGDENGEGEEEEEMQYEGEDGGASYYDENGNRIHQQQQQNVDYGEEGEEYDGEQDEAAYG